MARKHGNRGQVKIDPAGGALTVVVASLNEWTLDMTKDRADVTSFNDPNRVRVVGVPDFSGTFGGFYDPTTTPGAIFDVVMGTVAPFMELLPDSLEPTFLFAGLANLDGNIRVNATGAITIGGKWDAAGPWVMEP